MITVLVVIWFVGAVITGLFMRYLSNGRTAKASEDLFGHQPESWWQRRQVRRTTRDGNLLGAILWPVFLVVVLAMLAPSGIKSMLQYASTHSPSRRFLIGYGVVMLALVAAIVGVVVSKSSKPKVATLTTPSARVPSASQPAGHTSSAKIQPSYLAARTQSNADDSVVCGDMVLMVNYSAQSQDNQALQEIRSAGADIENDHGALRLVFQNDANNYMVAYQAANSANAKLSALDEYATSVLKTCAAYGYPGASAALARLSGS